MLGDEESGFFLQLHMSGFGFFLQNRHAHFQLRWFEFDGQAPREARFQTVVHVFDVGRQGVARHHHLFFLIQKMVKQIEEFFHGAVFARNKLHIINQQQIQ